MVLTRISPLCGFCFTTLTLAVFAAGPLWAEDPVPVVQKIEAVNTKVEMTVDSSRILSMDTPIPKAQVMNPELLDFTVISEKQVQIHAKKAGITTVNLWDEKEVIHSVDVVIVGDVRELERLLRVQFPAVSLKMTPTKGSTLIISGYVDRADSVNRIVRIAEEYYPKVINNMIVGGSQQVLLHVKVMEVSRTNLKVLGFDFGGFTNEGDFLASTVSGLITKASPATPLFRTGLNMTTTGRETFQFGVVNDPGGFVGFLEALKQEDLLKVLAEPNLVAVSGRPASYLVGGQVPIPQPTGFGNISFTFKDFGTQIDFVPIVLGNGGCRLEVRPQVSEVDPSLSITVNGTSVPGFRVRQVDTGVELKFGQTLAIAGLLQQTTVAQKKGIPYLMDIPYLGVAFSRKTNQINEVELLILVRPELIDPLDPEQVPPCGPGMTSMSPDDCGLYWKGYMEVPIPPGLMGPGPGPGPMGPGAATPGVAPEQITPPMGLPPADAPPSNRLRAPSPGESSEPPKPEIPPSARRGGPGPSGRSDAYNRSTSQAPQSGAPSNSSSEPPGFIGPVGYDVRN